MSIRFASYTHYNRGQMTTASTSVVVGPIDVREFDKFALLYQNNHTAIAFVNLAVQAAYEPSAVFLSGTGAPNWVNINTGTLPQPSALAASASVLTSAVDNAYAWIRVIGGMAATAVGEFRLTVGGFKAL